MKKIFRTITMVAIAASVNCFYACNPTEVENGNGLEGTVLKGDVTSDVTLEAGKTYTLELGVHVKSGATLTIEEGVTLIGTKDNDNNPVYLLVEQGGKINVEGTATNPVVMTCDVQEPGAWGGLHLCGKAPINVSGGTSTSEIGNAPYGGTDAADSSGEIRYLRIEYGGQILDAETEANGLTFYGVGSGTVVEYVQAYKGSDDGFEWFGGTVNVKYLVATSNSDDSFDWTQGWNGKAQFLVAYQEEASTLGYDCDCLIEADNNGDDNDATPASHPVLSNVTLIGNNSSSSSRGVRLRAGTRVELYNTLVKGKSKCITTQTTQTEASLTSGESKLQYIWVENTLTSESGGYSADAFVAAEGNAINQTLTFTNIYRGVENGGKDMSAVNSFFTATNYKGAVPATNDWTAGWTK